MHAYQMQRMRAANSHSSTRTQGPVVLPGVRTGAHASRVPSRRANAEKILIAAGCTGALLAGMTTAAWAIPYAMSQRATPAVGGELALIIIAGIAGWYAGIGCAALVLRVRRKGGLR